MSFICQSNFGPSLGHSLSKPVSREIPFRRGPRHCGQSAAPANTQKTPSAAPTTSNHRVFIGNLRREGLGLGSLATAAAPRPGLVALSLPGTHEGIIREAPAPVESDQLFTAGPTGTLHRSAYFPPTDATNS